MKYDRYSCQTALPEFGPDSQIILRKSRVLVVGLGGLGCPASLYLASMGIGTLGIVDHDIISRENLHRQVLFSEQDVGKPKVQVSAKVLKAQNPDTKVVIYEKKVTAKNALELVKKYDIVLDCTDNFSTRYLLNDACVLANKPLVYGAVFQCEGQVSVWNVNLRGNRSSNYRDAYPMVEEGQVQNCSDGGVIPTIAGIVGCMQATETIKFLIGLEGLLVNKLFIFNVKTLSSYTVALPERTLSIIEKMPSQTSTIEEVTLLDLKKLRNKPFSLIDVRSAKEHRANNIGGMNIPVQSIESNLDKIDPEKTTVFYCSRGVLSMTAAKKFKKRHPEAEVMSIKGGIKSSQIF